jgi:FkbM family methyltransferase
MLTQYLKHLLIRTPMEGLAHWFQTKVELPQRMRHPELLGIHQESHFIHQACRLLLSPDSNTVDVGAHLGSQLGVFVRLAPQGRHVAFEPVPYKAKWLRRKFPEVDVRTVALQQSLGESGFFMNITRPGYSGLRLHAGQGKGDVLEQITVACTPLDDALDIDSPVDLIKIDVEGAELSVLKGARGVLARWHPSLVFESTQSGLTAWGLHPDDLFTFLSELGYRVYLPRAFVCSGSALDQEEFAAAHVYPFRAFNFIAVAQQRPLGRKLGRKREVQRVSRPPAPLQEEDACLAMRA